MDIIDANYPPEIQSAELQETKTVVSNFIPNFGPYIRIKTVSVKYERKFQTAQYENVELGVTLWADLDPLVDGDICDPLIEIETLYQSARKLVINRAREILGQTRNPIRQDISPADENK